MVYYLGHIISETADSKKYYNFQQLEYKDPCIIGTASSSRSFKPTFNTIDSYDGIFLKSNHDSLVFNLFSALSTPWMEKTDVYDLKKDDLLDPATKKPIPHAECGSYKVIVFKTNLEIMSTDDVPVATTAGFSVTDGALSITDASIIPDHTKGEQQRVYKLKIQFEWDNIYRTSDS